MTSNLIRATEHVDFFHRCQRSESLHAKYAQTPVRTLETRAAAQMVLSVRTSDHAPADGKPSATPGKPPSIF
jgi:hypothetical protein